MPTVTVAYPQPADAPFDFDYYAAKHMPLVARHWGNAGLVSTTALKGRPGADGSPAVHAMITLLEFESDQALDAALGGPHASEIMGDIPNFTSAPPIVQVNDPVGD